MTAEFSLLRTGFMLAGGDLSALEDTLVKASGAAERTVLTVALAADVPIGVLRNAPVLAAQVELEHLVAGAIISIMAGATTATGLQLSGETGTARAIAAIATSWAFGVSLTAGADGSNFMVLIQPGGIL